MDKKRRRSVFNGILGKLDRRVLIGVAAVALIALIVLSLRPEPQLMASPEISIVKERGVLRVGVRDDINGFGSDGAGLEIQLAQLFAKRLLPNAPAEDAIELYTINSRTAGPHLDENDVDIVIGLQVRGESSKYAYSRSYYTDECAYVVLSANSGVSLDTARVGTLNTGWLFTKYKNAIAEMEDNKPTQVLFASYPDLMDALEQGEITAALMQRAYIPQFIREGMVMRDVLYGTCQYAAMTSSESSALTELFSIMVDELDDAGILKQMINGSGLPYHESEA